MRISADGLREYVELLPIVRVRSFIWGFLGILNIFNLLLFNFLNDIGLGRNLMQPPELIFVIITIAFDVWAVYILKQLKKRQKQFVLYSGLISIFLAIMYTAASYRIIYEILGIKSKFIAYIMAAFLLLCVFLIYICFGSNWLEDMPK